MDVGRSSISTARRLFSASTTGVSPCGVMASESQMNERLTAGLERAESAGRTAVAVGWDGQARGLLVVADTVKPTSAQAVEELVGLGLA
ncbi:MAG: hypothetical protein ACRD0W_08925, partial [Acidimicrobiales bacterium]